MFVIDESAFCVKGVGDLEVTSQKKKCFTPKCRIVNNVPKVLSNSEIEQSAIVSFYIS